MLNKTIGVIGCGNMGEALVKRIAASVKRGRLIVYDADSTKTSAMRRYKAVIAKDNVTLAKQCDVIILAVKPKDVEGLLGLSFLRYFNYEVRSVEGIIRLQPATA